MSPHAKVDPSGRLTMSPPEPLAKVGSRREQTVLAGETPSRISTSASGSQPTAASRSHRTSSLRAMGGGSSAVPEGSTLTDAVSLV